MSELASTRPTGGITVRVPATTANLGPGFDTFGLALKCYNRFHMTTRPGTPEEGDRLTFSQNSCVDLAGVSENPRDSLLFTAIDKLYQLLGKKRPAYHVDVEAHIPLARGMGSSSTVIVAGLVGPHHLEGAPLPPSQLVQLATEIEGHPDNVAPALLGGALLCDELPDGTVRTYPLPWPEDWRVVIAVPDYRLLTEKARAVLPKSFSMAEALHNLRKASTLTYALLKADPQAFAESLSDRLHQPFRGPLIPEFEPLREQALKAGAFGAVISGAGPSVAIFYPAQRHDAVWESLQAFKTEQASGLRLLPLAPDTLGAHVVRPEDGANDDASPLAAEAKI
jgi:homoserine kinase